MCLLRGTFYILRSAHTAYLCVLCGSQNKQLLFHCIALLTCFYNREGECLLRGTDWFFKQNAGELKSFNELFLTIQLYLLKWSVVCMFSRVPPCCVSLLCVYKDVKCTFRSAYSKLLIRILFSTMEPSLSSC